MVQLGLRVAELQKASDHPASIVLCVELVGRHLSLYSLERVEALVGPES